MCVWERGREGERERGRERERERERRRGIAVIHLRLSDHYCTYCMILWYARCTHRLASLLLHLLLSVLLPLARLFRIQRETVRGKGGGVRVEG